MTDLLVSESHETDRLIDPDETPSHETDSLTSPSAAEVALDPCKCPLTHETIDGSCDQFLPLGHGNRRVKCDGCQKGGWIHKGRVKADTPPVGVTINLPKQPPKLDTTQQKVKEAATAWMGMVAVVLEVQGDVVCAGAVKQAAPEVANQLAILSKFHPIIVKILAPVEATGEALAWISLALALSPVVLTVLTHHKVISEEAAARIGIVTAMGAVVGQAQATPEAQAA